MSFITDLLTGGAGSVVTAVAKGVDLLTTSDQERLAAENEAKRIGLEETQAYLQDTQSARDMQMVALQQDDLFSKRFVYWFAIVWSLFAMGFMLTITLADIPQDNLRMVDTILGFLLGTAIAGIFNFFLGTSVSSRRKDDTISSLARGKE